jgi:hypothetical protein
MADPAFVMVFALSVGAGHALLLWRLVGRLRPGAASAVGFVLGVLALRLVPATTLFAATWWGTAQTALVSLAGLWLGRTAVLAALRRGRS